MFLAPLVLAALPQLYSSFPEQDALSYIVDLDFDFDAQYVEASVEMRFQLLSPADRIVLHSIEDEKWEVQFQDSSGLSLETERRQGLLQVLLGKEFAKGAVVELHAKLAGTPPDGLYFEEGRHGDPVFFTDHFSSRARGWLPCEDHPSDRAKFSIRIQAPEGWEVIASGLDEDENGTWETQTDLPTYMLAFAAAPWGRIPENGDDRFIPHFIYKKDKPRARLGLKHHAQWMSVMEGTFGPYEWEKYCVVQVPTRWGGMENAGNTWIMERLFDGRDRGVGTLAHEFVHMWFGNAVGYGEWHEAWLSEGFASYFGPWLHAQSGGAPLQRAMEGSRRRWLGSRCSETRPIRWEEFEAPDDFFGSSAPNTYQKGAWVLHMLRGEIGDEAFFEGIRKYYEETTPGIATTDQFAEVMEKSSGKELKWFFEQWLDRPGCPQLDIRWNADSVVVKQLQEDIFRFRLPLQWTNGEGERKKKFFEVSQREHVFQLKGEISAPTIDPDVELLFR